MMRVTSFSRRQALLGGAAVAVAGTSGYANEEYPNRPIRLVVPFGAGSIADVIARHTSERAKSALSAIVIENRPGAAGSIGANIVAKAAPDGYTLCLGTVASHSIAAATINLPYDPVKDFTPISLLVSTWNLIAVNKNVPAQTLPEYLEYARKKGFSQYVSGGVGGTTTHLLPELMRIREKAPLQHIPTSNVATAFSDLLAGNVDMMCYPALAIQPHIQAGGARALAVASTQRIPQFANVPTVQETLKSNDYDLQSWFGLFAPAGTQDSIITKVSTAYSNATQSLKDEMEKLGAEAIGWGPEKFDPFFKAELPKWREVVRLTGTGSAK